MNFFQRRKNSAADRAGGQNGTNGLLGSNLPFFQFKEVNCGRPVESSSDVANEFSPLRYTLPALLLEAPLRTKTSGRRLFAVPS